MKAAGVQIIEASPAFVADVRQRTAPLVAGVDQVGQRQGRRRRQGLGRVPGRAEEGRRLGQVARGDQPRCARRRRRSGSDPRAALTRCAWILADEGHESGLAGQLTARGPTPARSGPCRSAWPSTRPRRRRGCSSTTRMNVLAGDGSYGIREPNPATRFHLWVYRARADVAGDRPHPSAGGVGARRRRAAARRRPHGRDAALRRHRVPARLARPAHRRSRRRADRRRPRRASTRCCSRTTACSRPAAACRRRRFSPSSSSAWRACRSTPRRSAASSRSTRPRRRAPATSCAPTGS